MASKTVKDAKSLARHLVRAANAARRIPGAPTGASPAPRPHTEKIALRRQGL